MKTLKNLKQAVKKYSDTLTRKLTPAHIADFPESATGIPIISTILLARLKTKFGILLIALCATFLGIAAPFFQRSFLDKLAGRPTGYTGFSEVQILFLAFFLSLLGQITSVVVRGLSARESTFAQKWLSIKIYDHTLKLHSKVQGKRSVGEVVTLYATDISGACYVLDDVLPNVLSSAIPVLIAPAIVSYIYKISAFSVYSIVFASIFLCVLLSIRQSKFFYMYKKLTGDRIGIVNDWLQNIRILRILNWTQIYENKIKDLRKVETKNRLSMVTNGSTMNSIAQVAPLLFNVVAVTSLIHVRGNNVSPGELFGLLWIMGIFLSRPMRSLPWIFVMSHDAISSARRLEAYFDLEAESYSFHADDTLGNETSASLKVSNLNLRSDDRWLLKDISLEIKSGEFVALIGEVGSGKSLLLQSLLRDTWATFDSYTLDDHNALETDLPDFRRNFSLVPQDGFVMSATLRDNITFHYGSPTCDDFLIRESLKLAQFDIANENLEAGLDTEIGERGVNLSGGQRQRVSIARAHFQRRPIILLDDALSAIDIETERKMNEQLFSGDWKSKTRILVTHRLTILPHTDRIILLQDGRIVAQGSYEELKKNSQEFNTFTQTVMSKSQK